MEGCFVLFAVGDVMRGDGIFWIQVEEKVMKKGAPTQHQQQCLPCRGNARGWAGMGAESSGVAPGDLSSTAAAWDALPDPRWTVSFLGVLVLPRVSKQCRNIRGCGCHPSG